MPASTPIRRPASTTIDDRALRADARRRRYRFQLERREFMRVFGVMGGGLVVLASMPPVTAQQESGRGAQNRAVPRELSAWLHIDEKGRVTGYTGKTEIGQNIRTSLAQAVADELRVPLGGRDDGDGGHGPGAVRRGHVRLADPRRGWRRSSRARPQRAREMLIDRAAARLASRSRDAHARRTGRVVAADGRSVTYGELTKGRRSPARSRRSRAVTAPATVEPCAAPRRRR